MSDGEKNQKRVALVTGASRGIGAAIARVLAEQHMTVVGTATSEAGAASISEALSGLGGTGNERYSLCILFSIAHQAASVAVAFSASGSSNVAH